MVTYPHVSVHTGGVKSLSRSLVDLADVDDEGVATGYSKAM